MYRRLISVLLLFASAPLLASALGGETVRTKNRTVYEGYISEQVPGKYIRVHADKVTVPDGSREISDLFEKVIPFRLLSPAAQEWVMQNDLSNGESAAEIKVYSFSSGDEFFEDMLKGDNGDYISFSSRSYLLEWKSIAGIEKEPVDVLTDIVETSDGRTLQGNIVCQTPGLTLTVRGKDGKEETVMPLSVTMIRTSFDTPQPGKDLPLLDVIECEGNKTITGLIRMRDMETQEVTVMTMDASADETVPMRSVKRYRKVPNPEFVPVVNASAMPEAPAPETGEAAPADGQETEAETAITCKLGMAEIPLVRTRSDGKTLFIPEDQPPVLINAGEWTTLGLPQESDDAVSLFRLAKKRSFKTDDMPVGEWHCYRTEDGRKVMFIIRESGSFFLTVNGFENGVYIEVQ